MPTSRRHFLALALGTVASAGLAHGARGEAAVRIGLLRSAASLRVSGWVGTWETDGAVRALRCLGLTVRVLYDSDLEGEALGEIDLLVVPNARCVARSAASRVDAWVAQGGRLLATGMASYRDHRNAKASPDNNFQWASLYGADFQRWIRAWPQCEFLALDAPLAAEVGAVMRGPSVHRIQLGRSCAMLVRPRAETQVLATWLQADGITPTSDSGSAGAAITQRDRVIYCGENLLAPELSRSPEVIALLLALIRRLVPNVPLHVPSALLESPAEISFPSGPAVDIAPSGPLVRVGLDAAIRRASVASRGGVRVTCGDTELRLSRGQWVEVSSEGDADVRLIVGGRETRLSGTLEISPIDRSQPLQFLHLRPNGTCRLQGFRGSVAFTPRDGALRAVNTLSIEEYTAGVVPNETPAVYPAGALRAMAVIARTFGLARRGYHKAKDHDMCATVDCQVYGGWLTEWDETNRAVNATRCQVAAFDGKPADTTFHAVCGGVGECVAQVWPQPASPYLVGTPDGPAPLPDLSSDEAVSAFLDRPPDSFCASSPRFRWRESWSLTQLQTLFEKSLPTTLQGEFHGLGTLQEVRVIERSPRGRVLKLAISGTEGQYVVTRDRIRWLWSGGLVGQGGLQSTLFRIVPRADGIVEFFGGGWGHGVGMCQEGAAGMARRGFDHTDIIRHYYPGTTVAPLALPSEA